MDKQQEKEQIITSNQLQNTINNGSLVPLKGTKIEIPESLKQLDNQDLYKLILYLSIEMNKNSNLKIEGKLDSMKEHIDDQMQDIKDVSDKILKAVQLKQREKKEKKTVPLRDPATSQIYYYIISLKRETQEKRLYYSRFRIAITLLWATGLRVSEIQNITQTDIQSIFQNYSLQILQPKTNKYRLIFFTEETVKQIRTLENDFKVVFKKHQTLSGNIHTKTWREFINRNLKKKTRIFNKNIKSHSFRVNYITSLLTHASLQVVKDLVGHANADTTLRYNRYHPNKDQVTQLLNKVFPPQDNNPTNIH